MMAEVVHHDAVSVMAAQLAVRLHQRANVLLRRAHQAHLNQTKQTNNNNKSRQEKKRKKKKRKRTNKRENILGRERKRERLK